MEIIQLNQVKDRTANGGYTSIHDDGSFVERKLIITDDDGNTITLTNEQIGELYLRIKPPLAG